MCHEATWKYMKTKITKFKKLALLKFSLFYIENKIERFGSIIGFTEDFA